MLVKISSLKTLRWLQTPRKNFLKVKFARDLQKAPLNVSPKIFGVTFFELSAVRAHFRVPEQVATNLLTTETEIMDISVIVVIGLVWSYLIFVGNQ